MSVYGTAPFGTDPGAFGGPGLITILGVLPLATNEVIVVFDGEPLADDPAGFDSATNPKNWTVAAVDPRVQSTADPDVTYLAPGDVVPSVFPSVQSAAVDEDDETQIHLVLDTRMERAVRYQIEAQPRIRGVSCEELVGTTEYEIRGLGRGEPVRPTLVQVDALRDLAYEFFPQDRTTPPNNYRITATGDIALQGSEDSLRKRILRRIQTAPGGFAHLPGYGLDPGIKRLGRTGEMQRLANETAFQARQEPDVEAATATLQIVTDDRGRTAVQVRLRVKQVAREQRVLLFSHPAAA